MNHPCVVAGFYDDIWMGPQILAHHLLLMLTVDLWESSKAAVSRDVHDCKNFIAAANGVKHGSYIFCNGPSQPLLFIFFLFKHKFYRKILYRRQRDSNLDCQSRRQACWPLDHLHGPMGAIFGSLNEFVSYYTIVCHNRDRSVRTCKGLCLVWRYKCEVFYFNSNSIKNTSKH